MTIFPDTVFVNTHNSDTLIQSSTYPAVNRLVLNLNTSTAAVAPISDLTTAERVIFCILMLAMAVGTVFGNVLVMLALLLTRRLRRPWNMLLLSLAAGDLLIGLIAEPVHVYSFLELALRTPSGKPLLPTLPLYCLFHWFDLLLGLAGILNMCTISLDRYLLVTQPMHYARKLRNVWFMCVLIGAVWTIAVLVPGSEMPLTFVVNGTWCVSPAHDGVTPFLMLVFVAFAAPIVVMAILWTRIALLATRKAKRRQAKSNGTKWTYAKLSAHNGQGTTNTSAAGVLIENMGGIESIPADDQQVALLKASQLNATQVKNGNNLTVPMPTVQIQSLNAKANNENKAIKTVAIIIGCFVVCWLPSFTMLVTAPVFSKISGDSSLVVVLEHSGVLIRLELFIDFFSYLNNFLNPLIYAKFDRDFREAFWALIHCNSPNRVHSATSSGMRMNDIVVESSYIGDRNETRRASTAADRLDPRRKSTSPFLSVA